MFHRSRRLRKRSATTVRLTVLSVALAALTLGEAPAADADGARCPPLELVVARGTDEPGHLGAVVGDPLYHRLRARVPAGVSAHRVNYPADLLNPASVSLGTQNMTGHLVHRAAQCPHQRYVLAGYSQGAVVTHGVLGSPAALTAPGISVLPPHVGGRVIAVLLFGDPFHLIGGAVPGHFAHRTASYCTAGDPVCGAGSDGPRHTVYGWAVAAAADYARSRF